MSMSKNIDIYTEQVQLCTDDSINKLVNTICVCIYFSISNQSTVQIAIIIFYKTLLAVVERTEMRCIHTPVYRSQIFYNFHSEHISQCVCMYAHTVVVVVVGIKPCQEIARFENARTPMYISPCTLSVYTSAYVCTYNIKFVCAHTRRTHIRTIAFLCVRSAIEHGRQRRGHRFGYNIRIVQRNK